MILNYQRWLKLNEQASENEAFYFTIEYGKLSKFPSNQELSDAVLAVFKDFEKDVTITDIEGLINGRLSFTINAILEKEDDPFGLPFADLGISLDKKVVLDLYESSEIRQYQLAAASILNEVTVKTNYRVYSSPEEVEDSLVIDEIVDSKSYSSKIGGQSFQREPILTYSDLRPRLNLDLILKYLYDDSGEATRQFMTLVKYLFRCELAKIRLASMIPFKKEKINLSTFAQEIESRFLKLQSEAAQSAGKNRQDLIDQLFDLQAYLISKISDKVSEIERKVATQYTIKVYDLLTELDPSDLESTNYLNK